MHGKGRHASGSADVGRAFPEAVGRCLRITLCMLVIMKLASAGLLLRTSVVVSDRQSFAQSPLDNTTLPHPRLCICGNRLAGQVDPLGRLGLRGGMTTEKICRRCYTAADMNIFRWRLLKGSGWFPLAAAFLSAPLILVAAMSQLKCWPTLQGLALMVAIYASGIDLFLCALMLLFSVDWGVFKSLCTVGHAFDDVYHVEVGLAEELYLDICGYSAAEHTITLAVFGILLVDLLALAALTYVMQEFGSFRGRKLLKWLASLAESADPVHAFDSRRGVFRQNKADRRKVPGASILGQPREGGRIRDFGVRLSLWGDGQSRHSRRTEEDRRDAEELDALDVQLDLSDAELDPFAAARRDGNPTQAFALQSQVQTAPLQLPDDDPESGDVLDSLFTKTRRAQWTKVDGPEVPDDTMRTQKIEALWTGVSAPTSSRAAPSRPSPRPVAPAPAVVEAEMLDPFNQPMKVMSAKAPLPDVSGSTASGSQVKPEAGNDGGGGDEDDFSDLLFRRPVRPALAQEEEETSDIFGYALRFAAGPDFDASSDASINSADSLADLETSTFADLFHEPIPE